MRKVLASDPYRDVRRYGRASVLTAVQGVRQGLCGGVRPAFLPGGTVCSSMRRSRSAVFTKHGPVGPAGYTREMRPSVVQRLIWRSLNPYMAGTSARRMRMGVGVTIGLPFRLRAGVTGQSEVESIRRPADSHPDG